MTRRAYVDVVYDEKLRPITEYPDLLTRYLVDRYGLRTGARLLDLGCGRGDFLRGFRRAGMDASGADQSDVARRLAPEAVIRTCDLEKDPIPFDENTFDCVYSKSVVEHFYYPERILREILRVLKPGGLVITMTPDWEAVYKIFYEDYTHRTPFTLNSLRDIHLIHGFDSVSVERFRQLPVLWAHPWLHGASWLAAHVLPTSWGKHSKFIRFSKEIMLLATGRKPAPEAASSLR